MLCLICWCTTDFVSGVEFPETCLVNALCPVSVDSANDVVGIPLDFDELVWPNPV